MTPEDRMLAALSRQEPDCVPLYDLVDNVAVLAHYAGEPITLENASQTIPRALGRALDHTRIWLPSAPGERTDERGFRHQRADWWNEWQVDTPFHGLAELAQFARREIERLEAPQAVSPCNLGRLQEWRDRFAPCTIPAVTAGEALANLYIPVGLDQFVMLEAEEPDLVQRWLEAEHSATLRSLEAQADCRSISPIAWIFADLAYRSGLMFSPRYLHDHGVFRHIHDMCEVLHGFGLKVIFHSDGDIRQMIPDLIEAGVDALAPIETTAGMDLGELKREYGDRVAFCGGLDMPYTLRYGSVDDVRRATLRAIAAAGPGGGLILGSSSEELYEDLPAANVIAMWETTRECGRYPIGQYFPKGFGG